MNTVVLGLQAATFVFCFALATGLVTEYGKWFSVNPYHREQIAAFSHGKLALAQSPAQGAHDLAWSGGGVQQVWGLGVPFWKWGAIWTLDKLCPGLGGEIPAFLALLWIATFVLLHCLVRMGTQCRVHPVIVLLPMLFVLLLLPPFFTVCHSRFHVYEEIIAYEYVIGLLLIALLIDVSLQPRWRAFLALCGIAGCGAFFRPTLFLIGSAATFVAALVVRKDLFRRNESRLKAPLAIALKMCVAGCAFAIPLFLLFFTNYLRFDHPVEFGHRLNVQRNLVGSMYSTRFDYPFRKESTLNAGKELFGLLFLYRYDVSHSINAFQPSMFPGQSSIPRYRGLYLTTFDRGYLFLIAAGWGTLLAWRCKGRDPLAVPLLRINMVLQLFSIISTTLLTVFYLRCPVITSRYMLDFMPGFAAGMAGLLLFVSIWGRRAVISILFLVLLPLWGIIQIVRAKSLDSTPDLISASQVADLQAKREKLIAWSIPETARYSSPAEPKKTGIPLNGEGWDVATGIVQPMVALYVKEPRFITLVLHSQVSSNPPPAFRIKIGLDELTLTNTVQIQDDWMLTFCGVKPASSAIRPVFVATVPPNRVADNQSGWILKEVRWR